MEFIPPSNGHGPGDYDQQTIKLSTGYEVQIEADDILGGFQHLARAIWGEIGFPAMEKSDDDPKVVSEALCDEIGHMVQKMDIHDLKATLFMSLWCLTINESHVIQRELRAERRKERKKRKR